MINALAVGIGGMIGSVLRYLLSSVSLGGIQVLGVPLGTLSVNVLGSFVLGSILGMSESKELFGPSARLFLITGILGGFTTFSTFSSETIVLVREGALLSATMNVVTHLLFGIGAVWVGFRMAGG